MKIKRIGIKGFKRFTDLTVEGIPETAKLIILVGPNGSGKTSLLEAFNFWYRLKGFITVGNKDYIFKKKDTANNVEELHKLVEIDFYNQVLSSQQEIKGKFYFRTAYRNEADFRITSLNQQDDPTQNSKLENLMVNDITVSENYQRLISQTLAAVYESSNNNKTVQELREELVSRIRSPFNNIFPDLNLSSIGDPLSNGAFYFEKGSSKDFHYKNLSAGEKSVFDLILDMVIKSGYFENAIYFIDEPETHINTRLQAKLLSELYNLTPKDSQLWISTHSIGILKQAELLEQQNSGSVVFLDFDNRDGSCLEDFRNI